MNYVYVVCIRLDVTTSALYGVGKIKGGALVHQHSSFKETECFVHAHS